MTEGKEWPKCTVPPFGVFLVCPVEGLVWQEGKKAKDFTPKQAQAILKAVDREFFDAQPHDGEWELVDDLPR